MTEPIGPVEIVGTGLIGTSIGLALRRAGIEVLLTDVSTAHLRTATQLGAGRPRTPEDRPRLLVVAVPPDHVSSAIEAAVATGAHVTDVGSVKSGLPEHPRYVGGHPMAGSERSGPLAASASLFDGRPWAVTAGTEADPETVALVEALVAMCGAIVVRLDPAQHDLAVARTSHVPHLLAALAASALADAPGQHLSLSGQGVRDVTRVAAGDPDLYGQIVTANSAAVSALLTGVRDRLDSVIGALAAGDRDGVRGLLQLGVDGTRAIPGKHGGRPRPTAPVFVSVPDEPGALARLFAAADTAGVNIEDVRIDHDPGREVGLVELLVAVGSVEPLHTSLESQGWVTHR